MGNCFVARKEFEDRFSRLEGRFSRLEGRFSRLEDVLCHERGAFYRGIQSTWKHQGGDHVGKAETWKRLREKDKETINYYTDPSAREGNGVRYYKDRFPECTLFPEYGQSMAHLIPSDPSCSLAWLRALSIVTGIETDENKPPLENVELRTFVEGSAPPEGTTPSPDQSTTPLKAWYWNFLKLPVNYAKHFDKLSDSSLENLIITPIWDPKEEWKPGTGYKLMVSASKNSFKWLVDPDLLQQEDEYKWIGATSDEQELKKATEFLALTVEALADLLVQFGDIDLGAPVQGHWEKRENDKRAGEHTRLDLVFKAIEDAIPSDLLSQRSYHTNSESKKSGSRISGKKSTCKYKADAFARKVKTTMNTRKNLCCERTNTRTVQIPVLTEGATKPVLVVDLGKYFEGNEHMIPDPFLVVLKAAVSWSDFCDQKLLPACGDHSNSCRSGSSVGDEESVPREVITWKEASSGAEDNDSLLSVSEELTGPPGDGMSADSPSGKSGGGAAVVTP